MLANPCCCAECLLASDDFTRANNADINAGSPIAYTIDSGTWSIASNRLAVSGTMAKVLFPVIGPEPTHARTIQMTCRGNTGDKIRFYAGGYYLEITIGSPGTVAYYDSSGNLLKINLWSQGNQSDQTITLVHGAAKSAAAGVDRSHYGLGLDPAVNLGGIVVEITGNEFGVGTGSVAAAVSFDSLRIYQNSILRTGASGSCLADNGYLCNLNLSMTLSDVIWNRASGTWAFSFADATCTAAGTLRYIGGWAGANPSITVTRPVSPNISHFQVWLDEGNTGFNCVHTGSGTYDIDLIVEGVTKDTISGSHSIFAVQRVLGTARFRLGTTLVGVYEMDPDSNLQVALVDDHSNSTSRAYAIQTFNASGAGPYSFCGLLDTTGLATCTGTLPAYELVFGGIIGTGASDINGVSFVTNTAGRVHGALPVNGVNAFFFASAWWYKLDPTPTDTRFVTYLQINNAWARFEYDTAQVACNSISGTPITLVDYHNADGLDMSAATCVATAQ